MSGDKKLNCNTDLGGSWLFFLGIKLVKAVKRSCQVQGSCFSTVTFKILTYQAQWCSTAIVLSGKIIFWLLHLSSLNRRQYCSSISSASNFNVLHCMFHHFQPWSSMWLCKESIPGTVIALFVRDNELASLLYCTLTEGSHPDTKDKPQQALESQPVIQCHIVPWF